MIFPVATDREGSGPRLKNSRVASLAQRNWPVRLTFKTNCQSARLILVKGESRCKPALATKNVNRSELRDDIAEHRDYFVLFADVGASGNCGTAVALDFADDLFGWRGNIRMIDDDGCPGICECNWQQLRRSRTRPGHDRDLSF